MAGPAPVMMLIDARREAGFLDDLAELEDGERVLRRRLDDGGAAHRERGGDLAGDAREREVVRA